MNNQMKTANDVGQSKNKNKSKSKFKQLFCIGALCSGIVSAGVVAADGQQSYGKLSKQLDIMNNIFVSSLQTQQDKSLKNTRIDSLYLAGQGVVFTVKSSSRSSWGRNSFSFSFSSFGERISTSKFSIS